MTQSKKKSVKSDNKVEEVKDTEVKVKAPSKPRKKSNQERYLDADDKRKEEKQEYNEIKLESFNQAKKSLPAIIEQRKQELIQYIKDYIAENELNQISYAKLYQLMSSGNAYNMTKYSAEELAISFEVYKQLTANLTLQNPKHFPSRQNFCAFIGIHTKTLEEYKLSDDPQMIDVALKIDDYLTDVQLYMAQTNQINAIPTMFRMKTEHGYVETKEVVQIISDTKVDKQSVKDRLSAINVEYKVSDTKESE